MHADRDPDLLLVESMLAPPPLDDARRSLEYWQRRQRNLPFYRRAARREAREMATHCEERVRAAEQARFEVEPRREAAHRSGDLEPVAETDEIR